MKEMYLSPEVNCGLQCVGVNAKQIVRKILKPVSSFDPYQIILCVYCCHYVCIAVFTLDAGLLARSQYSEGPATGHLDTGFS